MLKLFHLVLFLNSRSCVLVTCVGTVMWSETVGFRTRPVWDKKNRSWSWSCTFCIVLWDTILSRS